MMHDSKSVARLFAAPFTVWAVLFIVLPLFFVLYHGLTDGEGAFTLANLWEAVQMEYLRALGLSVELALVSTVICLVLAYPLCMILQEIKRGRMVLIFLLFLLPLWMNSLLTTMAWQTILEKNGIINMVLHALALPEVTLINTPLAIVIGMVYNFLPYMVQTFRRIVFPLSLPGVISGCTMVFIPALTTFVISALLGGNKILLIGNIIEQEFTAAYDWQLGSALSMILMVFIILNIVVEAFSERNAKEQEVDS